VVVKHTKMVIITHTSQSSQIDGKEQRGSNLLV